MIDEPKHSGTFIIIGLIFGVIGLIGFIFWGWGMIKLLSQTI